MHKTAKITFTTFLGFKSKVKKEFIARLERFEWLLTLQLSKGLQTTYATCRRRIFSQISESTEAALIVLSSEYFVQSLVTKKGRQNWERGVRSLVTRPAPLSKFCQYRKQNIKRNGKSIRTGLEFGLKGNVTCMAPTPPEFSDYPPSLQTKRVGLEKRPSKALYTACLAFRQWDLLNVHMYVDVLSNIRMVRNKSFNCCF